MLSHTIEAAPTAQHITTTQPKATLTLIPDNKAIKILFLIAVVMGRNLALETMAHQITTTMDMVVKKSEILSLWYLPDWFQKQLARNAGENFVQKHLEIKNLRLSRYRLSCLKFSQCQAAGKLTMG